jgi:hypothetical protein
MKRQFCKLMDVGAIVAKRAKSVICSSPGRRESSRSTSA